MQVLDDFKCARQDNCFLRGLGRIPQNGKNWSPVGDLHNFTRELSTEHASPKIAIFRAHRDISLGDRENPLLVTINPISFK